MRLDHVSDAASSVREIIQAFLLQHEKKLFRVDKSLLLRRGDGERTCSLGRREETSGRAAGWEWS